MTNPMLRFKADGGTEFPEWEEKRLEELGEFIGGGTPSTKVKEYWKGTIPWISSSDVFENDIQQLSVSRFITEEAIEKSATKRIPENSICIVCRVGVGKVVIAPFELCTSQDFVSITALKDDICFLGYAMWNLMRRKISDVRGTSIKGIPVKDLREYMIDVPSLPEQRKIADLLSAVDDVIAAQEAEVAAWEKRKKGVMQKLFSQEVRFKADDGSEFPDWEEKMLGELGCFCSGVGFSERYQGHVNLPVDVYKVSDMNVSGNEREMLRANNTVDESILKKMKTKAIDQPSIIFAKVGAAIFAERKRIARKPFIVDNNMMVFTPNDENDFEYIYWLTLTLRFASRVQIGALPSYNASDISGFMVNIPSLPEQRKIADCLTSMDEVIQKAKDELAKWQELKKGLLQQMFV